MAQFGPNTGRNPQSEALAQIEAALGPERTADYKLALDPAYQQVTRLLTRLELPSTLAPQVVAVQHDTEQRANDIRRDRTLSAEARTGQLTALEQEAQAKLTSTIGENGLAAYRSLGGWWLNNLVQRSGPASPAVQISAPPKN